VQEANATPIQPTLLQMHFAVLVSLARLTTHATTKKLMVVPALRHQNVKRNAMEGCASTASLPVNRVPTLMIVMTTTTATVVHVQQELVRELHAATPKVVMINCTAILQQMFAHSEWLMVPPVLPRHNAAMEDV
jgi:hypothetical protein